MLDFVFVSANQKTRACTRHNSVAIIEFCGAKTYQRLKLTLQHFFSIINHILLTNDFSVLVGSLPPSFWHSVPTVIRHWFVDLAGPSYSFLSIQLSYAPSLFHLQKITCPFHLPTQSLKRKNTTILLSIEYASKVSPQRLCAQRKYFLFFWCHSLKKTWIL